MTAHVSFGEALDLMQGELALLLVDQLDDDGKAEPLTFAQKVELAKGALESHRIMAGWLHDAQRREIPTPRHAVPAEARERVLARDGHRCLACGTTENLTVDHVVSLNEGGAHEESNFQTLCGPCNSGKGVMAVDYRLS